MTARTIRFPKLADPRLLLGVLLVTGGGVAGSILFGGDTTVPLARMATNVAAGSEVSPRHIEVVSVPESIAENYVPAEEIPQGALAEHSLTQGDFLAFSDLTLSQDGGVDVYLPLLVQPANSLRVGDTAQVWRISRTAAGQASQEPELITDGAIVVAISDGEQYMDGSSAAQVRVDSDVVGEILEVLGTQDGFAIVSARESR